jgi:hypothetical protein
LHRLATLLVLVLGASSTVPVKAQSAAAPAQTVVRYHYGDDADGHLGWAHGDFDDSSWPIAPHGRPPVPPFASDGFLWIRARVPVPDGVAEPLALQSRASRSGPDVQELFSNGLGTPRQPNGHLWKEPTTQGSLRLRTPSTHHYVFRGSQGAY